MRPAEEHPRPAAPKRNFGEIASALADRALLFLFSASLLLIPCVVAITGNDVFRSPKELAFRAAAIILIAAVACCLLLRIRTVVSRPPGRLTLGLTGAIVGWTAISAVFSTNVPLSLNSLATVIASAVLFLLAVMLLRERPLGAVLLCALPAGANAVVSLCQYFAIWRPFTIVYERHDVTQAVGKLSMSGFVGSPNDIGMVTVLPALATIVLTIVAKEKRLRAMGAGMSALLVAALFASQSVTAIGAFVVAVWALLFLALPRRGGIVVAAGTALLIVAMFGYAPLRERFASIGQRMKDRQYNQMLAGRLQPYMAAANMFADRPLLGTGPGTFHWHYMPYRVEIGRKHPELFIMPGPAIQNFGEAHNDHLEVLAETGLPGYLLLLATLILLARPSFRRRAIPSGAADGEDAPAETAQFTRLFALPFVAGFATLALAQFPLQIAAARLIYLSLAALIVAWSATDE
ncbi:MAG TPA: O-antigen ligase family protein [Thermoanaerobaculia bacterium]|jgi:O-antigen ligase